MKASLSAVPATIVRLNIALPVTFGVDAVTENGPTDELAVIAGDVAMPSAPVISGTTCGPLAPPKVTVAPLEGAVNVTVAPETGLPKVSSTSALSGDTNVPPAVAV